MKKKYVCLFIFSATTEEVEEKEKKSPNNKSNINKNNICCIFFDLDLYTSTINFLNQIPKIKDHLLPRVLCYFDDVYVFENYINQFNGVFKAIDDFNNNFSEYKLGYSVDHFKNFKFPLAKTSIYTLHSFKNDLYKKYISTDIESDLSLGSKHIRSVMDYLYDLFLSGIS